MKFKKEFVILILVIVALSIYLATRSRDRAQFELPQIAPVDTKSFDRLVFQKGDTTIELNKRDNRWFVGEQDYLVDAVKARNMVKAVAELKITALVSESGNLERYDLTDDKKTNIQAFSGKDRLRNFHVGRSAPTFQHSFVRLDNDKKVYHARGQLHNTFDVTVAELRDETVLQFEQDAISSLVLEKDGRQMILVKKQAADKGPSEGQASAETKPTAQWQRPDGEVVDLSAVNDLLRSFKQLNCDDYMADDAKSSLSKAVWTIRFKAPEQSHHISIFEKQNQDDIEFPAVSSGSAYAFFLAKSRVERFEKTMERLMAQDGQPE